MALAFLLPIHVAFTEFKIYGQEPERVYDRCFRIRHKEGQVITKFLQHFPKFEMVINDA